MAALVCDARNPQHQRNVGGGAVVGALAQMTMLSHLVAVVRDEDNYCVILKLQPPLRFLSHTLQ